LATTDGQIHERQEMSKWTFFISATKIDGETASGDPVHVTPSPVQGLYTTTDASEAAYLNSHPKAVLVEFSGGASPSALHSSAKERNTK
jgi:hypothetical protein